MTQLPEIHDTNRHSYPCWLQLPAAAAYCGIARVTLLARIAKGIGPKFSRLPASRNKLFYSLDLDDWIRSSPVRALTPGEQARSKKLQAGNLAAHEKRRAQRDTQATLVLSRGDAGKRELHEASPRPRDRRVAKTREDVTA